MLLGSLDGSITMDGLCRACWQQPVWPETAQLPNGHFSLQKPQHVAQLRGYCEVAIPLAQGRRAVEEPEFAIQ